MLLLLLKMILLPKMDFSSKAFDFLSDRGNNRNQGIRSHMGLGIIEDFFLGTMPDKFLKNKTGATMLILYQGIQLSVRKGSCSSFPKLGIGFLV